GIQEADGSIPFSSTTSLEFSDPLSHHPPIRIAARTSLRPPQIGRGYTWLDEIVDLSGALLSLVVLDVRCLRRRLKRGNACVVALKPSGRHECSAVLLPPHLDVDAAGCSLHQFRCAVETSDHLAVVLLLRVVKRDHSEAHCRLRSRLLAHDP